MATTTDETIGGDEAMPSKDEGQIFTLRRRYNCKTVALGGEGNVTSGDTLALINIPANTFVWKVAVVKYTAEGATQTVGIGDGSATSGFITGCDLNSTTTEISSLTLSEAAPNTVSGYTDGKLYTAADTIDAIFNNTADTADFEVIAFCMKVKADVSRNATYGAV